KLFFVHNKIPVSECIISETGIYTNCGRGSVKRLFALITPQKTISAIFGYRNLSVNFEGISLQYELQAPVLHITLANSWIFFDVINSLELPFEVQVANYAEELVHAFMNTTDEDFTHRIVELICPSVSCCKGYFELR
ncbi:hypothetical protein, partial [Glaesserella parasuis]